MKTQNKCCTELTEPNDTYQSYWNFFGQEVIRNKGLGYRTAVTDSCGMGSANLFRWDGKTLEHQRSRGLDLWDKVDLEQIMPSLFNEVAKVFPEAIQQHFAV